MHKKTGKRGISFVAGVLAVFFLGIFTALIITMYVYQVNIFESDIVDVKFAIVKDSVIVEDGVLKFELKNVKNAENISGIYILVKDTEGNKGEVNVSGSIDANGSRRYLFNFEKIGLKDVYSISVAPIINYKDKEVIGRIRVLYREGKEVEDKESDSAISRIINILIPKNQTTPAPEGGSGGGGSGSGGGGGGGGGSDELVAPSNVRFYNIYLDSVGITWDDVRSEKGYRIERKESVSEELYGIGEVGQDIISFDDSSLDENKTYYYRIVSFSDSNSKESNIYSVKTITDDEKPVCLYKGTEREEWYYKGANVNQGKCTCEPKCDKVGTPDEGYYDCNGNLLSREVCS